MDQAVLRLLALSALAISAAMTQSTPNSTPNFSGTWVPDSAKQPAAAETATPLVTLTIKQTPGEISIVTQQGSASDLLVYKLDSSESAIDMPAGNRIVTKAHWEGAKLITETSRTINGAAVTTSYILSLNSTGRELTIDKSLVVQHGYRSEKPRNTGSGKEVYVLVKDSKP